MKFDRDHIRNFSIIAHIDHGKSTLADRVLELTETISKREMHEQYLDSMDLERERGITIKLNAVTIKYKARNGETYLFNLIDTPGHVDFTYEVSRSLAACEGCLLVVDATQGVEAQTLANVYLAVDNNLEIVPVINKIDLPSAMPEVVKDEIEKRIGISCANACEVSAKTGVGVPEVLESVVKYIPSPRGDENKPLQALIFDSYYDSYRGVVVLICVKNGTVKVGDKIKLMAANKEYEVTEVGIRTPKEIKVDSLSAGEVGYLAGQIKDIRDVVPGDTITNAEHPCEKPLPGYRKMNPMVYCGLYPVDSKKYLDLKDALEKLSLNDASLVFEAETSQALGFGFRCGFLGLLHMDVVQERLEREYGLDLILTAPSVIYHVYLHKGDMIKLDNPSKLPDLTLIKEIQEPFVKAEIMTPKEFVGPASSQLSQRGGSIMGQDSKPTGEVIHAQAPMANMFGFTTNLRSATQGRASFSMEFSHFQVKAGGLGGF